MNVDANADIIEADILEMLKHSTVLCSVDVEKKALPSWFLVCVVSILNTNSFRH